jgi:NAD+ synthetase
MTKLTKNDNGNQIQPKMDIFDINGYDYNIIIKNIRKNFKEYLISNKIKSVVLGISGGIDSCLVAALAKPICEEIKIPLIGVSLPTKTNKSDEIERARRTMKAFCTEYKEVYLDNEFELISNNINTKPFFLVNDINNEAIQKSYKIRNGNIKARIRMIYLYDIASSRNGMVLSTDNYTEYLLGFWTLHGDVGDYGMIQQLWKTEVYDMAEFLVNTEYKVDSLNERLQLGGGIIGNTIQSMATDGLGVTNNGDLGQILPNWKGNSREGYREVDKILYNILYNSNNILNINILDIDKVTDRYNNSKFKRLLPVNIARKDLIYDN